MEKEVKKKRVKKEAVTVDVQGQVAAPTEPLKKPRKPRAKKAETSKEVAAKTPKEEVQEKAQEAPIVATEEQPKTTKKPRAKKAQKEVKEAPAEETKEEKHEMTRAEKKDAVRDIVKELVGKDALRRSALIEEASRYYVERYPSQETANVNDVKGRVGSVITLMEQSEEIFYVDGKMRLEKPQVKVAEKEAEKTAKPIPAPVKEEFLPVPAPESKLAPVFDLSALLGEKAVEKANKKAKQPLKKEEDPKTQGKAKPAEKSAEKPVEKVEKKAAKKATEKVEKAPVKKAVKSASQEKLKEKFLKKIRSHGGSYLEYYAIYLLQRYAHANGRRLEGLRVCGGKADGGIDGEIEVSDRFGFRETLYVQAKNWEPTDEKWMVGETLLQQFIGAVTYRMVQDGKAHGRGVYVTTSKFSERAKKMLDDMSETYVGYDGDALFDLAKECNFGVVQKDGEWMLDDNLLAGEKAFFNM